MKIAQTKGKRFSIIFQEVVVLQTFSLLLAHYNKFLFVSITTLLQLTVKQNTDDSTVSSEKLRYAQQS